MPLWTRRGRRWENDCRQVLVLYRRGRVEMPAFREGVDGAIAEGVEFQFLAVPVRILAETENSAAWSAFA